MALVRITPAQLAYNVASADLPIASGTAIDAAEEHRIAYPEEGKLFIMLNNTTAASKNFTVKAGSFSAAGQGDLVIAMAQNDVRVLVVDSARLKDSAGDVVITVEANTTGFIMAFYLP